MYPSSTVHEVEFSERMAGRVSINLESFGGNAGEFVPMEFSVTITISNLQNFMNQIEDSRVFGMARISTLPALTISDGRMRLFVPDNDNVFNYQMQYELPMQGPNGQKLLLVGWKNMSDEHGLNCFASCGQAYFDTTHLQCVLYEGFLDLDQAVHAGKVAGRGMLTISFKDVFQMISSFRGRGSNKFKAYFVGSLVDIYFRAFCTKQTPLVSDEIATPLPRKLNAPEYEQHTVTTKDGEELPLKRFNGGASSSSSPPRGVIICTHSLTTSDLMYMPETIEKNFVEACTEQGYDVWTVSLRFGRLVQEKKDYDLDDVAKYDYPAVFDYIESATNPASRKGGIHVHAQCFGAMSFCMSVMGGHIDPGRVKGLVCNQLGVHCIPSKENMKKLTMGIPEMMTFFGIKEYRPTRDPKRTFSDRAMDWAASYILPIPWSFRTDSVEQARISLLFHELWNNEMMNRATVERLSPDFGTMNVRLLKHAVECVKAGHAVNAKGKNVYLPNMYKLAQIPTTFQFGTKSGVFQKEAIIRDLALFQEVAEQMGYSAPEGKGKLHQLVLAEGHGHMDALVGKTAYKTAYPDLLDHFAKWDTVEARPAAVTRDMAALARRRSTVTFNVAHNSEKLGRRSSADSIAAATAVSPDVVRRRVSFAAPRGVTLPSSSSDDEEELRVARRMSQNFASALMNHDQNDDDVNNNNDNEELRVARRMSQDFLVTLLSTQQSTLDKSDTGLVRKISSDFVRLLNSKPARDFVESVDIKISFMVLLFSFYLIMSQ